MLDYLSMKYYGIVQGKASSIHRFILQHFVEEVSYICELPVDLIVLYVNQLVMFACFIRSPWGAH